MGTLGFEMKDEAFLKILSMDVEKSSEIEGENLNSEQVRSSVARHLGMHISGLIPSDRNVDGMVDIMYDATHNYKDKLYQLQVF